MEIEEGEIGSVCVELNGRLDISISVILTTSASDVEEAIGRGF